MGKNKLARWAEMKSFNNVIEPPTEDVLSKDHILKGNWNKVIFKNENPVIKFKSDFATRFALGICVAGIVVTGFASIIFEAIRNLSFGI